METQQSEGGSIPSVNSQFLCQNKPFGASDNYMYINTTVPHKLLRNTRRASVIKNSLYINFDSNVNILNCVQAEVRCFRCAKSAHTRFVCASIITDKHVPNARLLYVTIIVFTLITIVIHQNLANATLDSFIQPRAVHCKKKKLSQLKILKQPASADFWVFSTSCFKFVQQKVEKFPKK